METPDTVKIIDITDQKNNILNGKFGQTVYEIFCKNENKVYAPCGGKHLCGKCKAVVTGDVSGMEERESSFLSAEEIENGVRLVCMCAVHGEAKVKFNENTDMLVKTSGEMGKFEFNPSVKQIGRASCRERV